MKLIEHISWILDPLDENNRFEQEYYQKNIDFVHSLGMKCDCVGWSTLDLHSPDAEAILQKIEAFCREDGWKVRGGYGRDFADFETDWYALRLPEVPDTTYHYDDRFEKGWRRDVCAITAYKCKNQPILELYHEPHIVSERAKEKLMAYPWLEAEYCPVRDVGRYASEAYYFFYPKVNLSHFGEKAYFTCYDTWRKADRSKDGEAYRQMEALGGMLPRLAETFYDLQVNIPICYPAAAMPREGFCLCYSDSIPGGGRNRINTLLVRKDRAEEMMRDKLIARKNLSPVYVYDEIPSGYKETLTERMSKPELEHFIEMQKEAEKLAKKNRPMHKATEKQALSLLRKTKTDNKDSFGKRMKKELNESLAETAFAPLAPYYLIADGGSLSDEYEFLPCEKAKAMTEAFYEKLEREELLEQKPDGVVIAWCPDGDHVLYLKDGKVVRFSHEAPEIMEEWETLAQFFTDAIEEYAS